MAINWKLRETILRLLSAVYAEIGEEGFKGRYGRIAQLFGPDATYDAIKSFFAKEISRRAERLKAQHPRLRGTGRRISHRGSRCSLDGVPTYIEEDDEMQDELDGEEIEEVRMPRPQQVRRYFADPPRRPTTIDLTTENEASETPSQQVSVDSEPPQPVTNGVNTTAGRARQQHQQPANTRQKITSPAGHQRPGPSRTRSALARQAPPSRPTARKRPHHIAFDVDDAFIETDETDDHAQQQSESSSPLFGYATRDNKYRCALCSNTFSSQQALDRHEDSNRAHQINLTNAFMVERAHSRLANIHELETAMAGPSTSSNTTRPTYARRTTGNDTNGEISTPPTQTIHAQSHQRSQHPPPRPRPVSVLSTFDEGESESISLQPPEVRSMLFSNTAARTSAPGAPSTSAPSESPITPATDQQANSVDKGKGRAITPELTPSTAIGRGGEDDPRSRAWSSSDNASAELQLHRSLARAQQGVMGRDGSTDDDANHQRDYQRQQQPPSLQPKGTSSRRAARPKTAPSQQPAFPNARATSSPPRYHRPQPPQPQPQTQTQTQSVTQAPVFPPPSLTQAPAPPHPSTNASTAPTGAPSTTTTTTAAPPSTNTTTATHPDHATYATAITQLRASIGVLGERYIATHPEWLAQMMAAVQREVVQHNLSGGTRDDSGVGSSASASASAYSDASREMPPPPPPPPRSISVGGGERAESVGTTVTQSSSAGESDVMRGLWVGSRVGFGSGGGGATGGRASREDVPGQDQRQGGLGGNAQIHCVAKPGMVRGGGRAGKGKRADTVVILVD